MFGNLFGNLEERKEEMLEKLQNIELKESTADQEITVTFNAARQILDIKINPEKISTEDTEAVEDLLLTCMNKVMETITKVEAEENQKMIKEMLPPGMGGLGNLFG